MVRFIRKFIVFLIVSFFLYVISLNIIEEFFSGPFKPNILYQAGDDLVQRKIEESKNIDSLDILFIGSSHAYGSFDPLIFEKEGFKVYNWGTSQQSHLQTRMILDKYLKELKPKMVVYEVFPEIFSATGRESMADFLNAGKPFEVGFLDLFQYDNSISLLNTYLIKESRELFNMERESVKLKDEVRYYKGYVEKREKNSNKALPEIKWVPRNNQLYYFEENLKELKSHDIQVLLVIAPFPFKYENMDEIKVYLKQHGKLIDYNEKLEFDINEDFSDSHHMNYIGVEKMNKDFIRYLKKEYSFLFDKK